MNIPSIIMRKIEDLKPHPKSARTHSSKQLCQIAASITRFGCINPSIVDQNDFLVAGHGRIAAAKLLNVSEIPVIRLTDMSEAQVRAYMVADNRLAEKAGWDKDLLKIELAYQLELDVDVDPQALGFDPPEIDALTLGCVDIQDFQCALFVIQAVG